MKSGRVMRILFNILVKYRQHFFTDLVSIELFRRPVFRYPQQTIASVARSTHRYKPIFYLATLFARREAKTSGKLVGSVPTSYFFVCSREHSRQVENRLQFHFKTRSWGSLMVPDHQNEMKRQKNNVYITCFQGGNCSKSG